MENITQPSAAPAQPQMPQINMEHIKQIESSGNPMAFNKHSKARGLYQITPIVLDEWNNFNKKKRYSRDELFNPKVNEEIASWYMSKRIPQMLTHFKKPVTVDNILTSYNAGIRYVVDESNLPGETKDYIKKYYDRQGGQSGTTPTVS